MRLGRPIRAVVSVLLPIIAALSVGTTVLRAQAPAPAAPYTFHIYEDLVQLPTMVLNRAHESESGLTTQRFTIRLDSGPPFHPSHLRLEGDDPLNVALVLDTSDSKTLQLAQALAAGEVTLPRDWLHSSDRVTVYALDCTVIQTMSGSVFTPLLLQQQVAAVLRNPKLHGSGTQPHCTDRVQLWSTLAAVAQHLGEAPGRRAIFAVTPGKDNGSQISWNGARIYAGRFNVALLGLQPQGLFFGREDNFGWSGTKPPDPRFVGPEQIFPMLCGETGGLVFPVQSSTLASEMVRGVALLRQRYILDFPRPSNGTTGLHEIVTTLDDRGAVVRTTGVTFPLQNKRLLDDPSTLPSDPSRAPVQGNRRILTQPQ